MLMAGVMFGGFARPGGSVDPPVDVTPHLTTAVPSAPRGSVQVLDPVPLPGAPRLDDSMLPVLYNRGDMEAAIRDGYPRDLQASGIGGDVVLRLSIDETGRVQPAGVSVIRSDRTDLGFAAASVGGRMEFRPALEGGTPIPSTVDITIRFTPEP
jgi:TonB family protein